MLTRLPFDDVAWEQSDIISDAWVKKLFERESLMAIGNFIARHRKGTPVELCSPKAGTFNVTFRLIFEDGGSAIIRFPQPGVTMFPEEKVRNEVAMLRYIREHTTIPVPFVLHWGKKEQSPLELGAFIIMEYIDHAMELGDALNTPGFAIRDRPILDPKIDQGKLEMVYGQVADILLQLSTLSLPRIGSLTQIDDFTWEVNRRPLSIHMNELVRLGTLPRSELPEKTATFETASAYFNTLAELHLRHLSHQRNDSIQSESDCRRKCVARYLFRKLAKEGRLSSSSTDSGPFKLWCDDLRPSNILVDDNLRIVGVIDWEFTYAAPAEFSHAAPWWLLLEQPEYWPGGIDGWAEAYEPRLETFLKALIERENVAISEGKLQEHARLSGPMRRSWDSDQFWVTYAARKNFAFDSIFWWKLDDRYFGPLTKKHLKYWQERFELLEPEEQHDTEKLVSRKLEEMESRVLAWEPDEQP